MMKLYAVVGSPNCRKVLAVIHHLELNIDIDYLDFFEGDLTTAEYLALNQNGMVPTLVDGDFSLWESNAIMQYLADTVPGNTLFPKDPKTRADILRWQCWELAHYNKALGVLSYEAIVKPMLMGEEANAATVEWAVGELNRFAPVLESHLGNREFVVGNDVTLADYSLIHIHMFKDEVPFDWSPFPNINDYYRCIGSLPHWTFSLPANMEAVGRRPAA